MAEKKYGHFDDANREYVITDPKTPWPWINYLGNEDFFSLISNTAGGYSFYKDAKFRRITRYRYNGVPMDNGGRYFYIKDGDTVWNPGWKPCKTPLDSYECRHGMNYTRITGSKNGVEASVLFFVPLHTWAEVQKMTLKNNSKEVKSLKVFSFAEWCLWNAATDMENFQRNFSTGEVEVEGSTIYHKTEYRERRNHYAFYTVNTDIQGYDTDRESFIGLYNEFADPEAVMEGKPRNSFAHGWSPIASHYIEVTLLLNAVKLALGDSKQGEAERTWIVKLIGIRFESEQKQVMGWVEEFGLQDHVTIIPFIERKELLKLMKGCSLSVYPAFRDSGSMSVLEACAIGCPTVCFDAGGQSVFPNDILLKVHVEDIYNETLERFASSLKWGYEHPIELKTLGEKAKSWVEANLTWEKRVEDFYQIYRKLLES